MKKTWMLSIIITFTLVGLFLGSMIFIPVATSAPLAQFTTWATTTSMPETLSYHGAVVEAQKKFLYISGGNKNLSQPDIIQTVRFAAIANNGVGPWNSAKELPIELFQHAVVAVGNYLYVIGGWDGEKARADVFRATVPGDGRLTEWVPLANYSSAINFHEAVVVNHAIYVVGGRINNNERTNEVRYTKVNTATGDLGSWTLAQAQLPQVVSAGAVAAHNGYIYVTGGFNGKNALDTVYYAQVNPDGNITDWKTTNFTPVGARYFHEVLVIDGKLVILGGTDGSTEKADVWAAQINSDGSLATWVQQPGLPESLQQFAAVSVDQSNGSFLSIVLGGRHGADFRNQVYAANYTRPTPTVTPTPTATPTPGLQVYLENYPARRVESGDAITYEITYRTVNYGPVGDGIFTNVILSNSVPLIDDEPLDVQTILDGGQEISDTVVWQIGTITMPVTKTVSYIVVLPESFQTAPIPLATPYVENRGVTLTWTYSGTNGKTTSGVVFNNALELFMPFVPKAATPIPSQPME